MFVFIFGLDVLISVVFLPIDKSLDGDLKNIWKILNERLKTQFAHHSQPACIHTLFYRFDLLSFLGFPKTINCRVLDGLALKIKTVFWTEFRTQIQHFLNPEFECISFSGQF